MGKQETRAAGLLRDEAAHGDDLEGSAGPRARRLAAVRVGLDVLVLSAASGLAAFLRFRHGFLEVTKEASIPASNYVFAACLWVVATIRATWARRLYDEDTLFRGGGEITRLWRAVLEGVATVTIVTFLLHRFTLSRGWFLATIALSLVLLAGERAIVRGVLGDLRARGRLRRPAIAVGTNGNAMHPDLDGEFIVSDRLSAADFLSFAREVALRAGEGSGRIPQRAVLLNPDGMSDDEFWRVVLEAGELGWSTYLLSPIRTVAPDRLTTRELGGRAIVRISSARLTGERAMKKRALDLLAMILLAPLAVPLSALGALAVLVTSGWPVLYSQERVGCGEKTFRMLKFRTMRRDAESDGVPVWATTIDPRRTPIGRFLRRTSLDELPQLWNVLRGDMSLVGPRPERPPLVHRFGTEVPWYEYRHRIRPGITGHAQVNGLRGNTSLDSRIAFDNWYIENWSVALDVKILGRTVVEIFRGRNAY